MNTFSICDCNKPMQFFTNCTGCILKPMKMDQVTIITATGDQVPVGIQLPHDLSVRLYEKVLEASQKGGTITIPDFYEMNDDEILVAIDSLEIK